MLVASFNLLFEMAPFSIFLATKWDWAWLTLCLLCVLGKSTDSRTDLGASEIPSWPCNMAGWQEDSIIGRGKTRAGKRDSPNRRDWTTPSPPQHVLSYFQLLFSMSLTTLLIYSTFHCERSFHSAIKKLFWFSAFYQLSCLCMSLYRLSQIMTISVEELTDRTNATLSDAYKETMSFVGWFNQHAQSRYSWL